MTDELLAIFDRYGIASTYETKGTAEAFGVAERTFGNLENRIADVEIDDDRMLELERRLAELEKRVKTLKNIEAFFGPLVFDKTPPIDDEVIATKAFVTDAIARIARELNTRITQIKTEAVKPRAHGLRDRLRAIVRAAIGPVSA